MSRLRKTAGEGLRFALVGAFATALHYGVYYALLGVLPVLAAYTAGYALSFAANFYLTARFTFRTAPTLKRLAGMAGAHAVNYALHIALLSAALRVGIPETCAPLPVFAIAVTVNFLLVRLVFKKKK